MPAWLPSALFVAAFVAGMIWFAVITRHDYR